MFQIGPYSIHSRALLAPMAGVTDLPFRRLCKQFGAGMVTGEMLTSDTRLWNSRKSQQRMLHIDEAEPRAVQIAGGDAQMLATAAQQCVERGAQIVDINMGCPAKKVCNKAAGSALLKDEKLVAEILDTVVNAVDVPVTLKIRTGWSTDQRNGLRIAKLAENSGIQALAVHGRSRACRFKGEVEYDTIAEIAQQLRIPVIANGDIDSAIKAKQVLDYTGADAVMIGRAAQGQPWLFEQVNNFLDHGKHLAAPRLEQIEQILLQHITALHEFYGEYLGLRIARKHLGWYLQNQNNSSPAASKNSEPEHFRKEFNQLEQTQSQLLSIKKYFQIQIKTNEDQAA